TPSPSLAAPASTVDLTFAILRSGTGMASMETERAPDGTPVALISNVNILLSPLGRLQMFASYGSLLPNPPFLGGALELLGTVVTSEHGVTANGVAFVGLTPSLAIAGWTAERLP